MPHQAEDIIAQIAQDELFIETLIEQKSDSADFHDLHVAGIKRALEAAFAAGAASAKLNGMAARAKA